MSDFSEIFFKMQVISENLMLAMYEFWGWESELLGTLEGAVIGIPAFISWKITKSYRFFGIFRVRRLHLACSVE
jgi:hypothetical protein